MAETSLPDTVAEALANIQETALLMSRELLDEVRAESEDHRKLRRMSDRVKILKALVAIIRQSLTPVARPNGATARPGPNGAGDSSAAAALRTDMEAVALAAGKVPALPA